jgi:hypothetical protein
VVKVPVGVSYAVVPGSRYCAISSYPAHGGLSGIDLTSAWQTVQGIISPASEAAVDAFKSSISRSITSQPQVQQAAFGAAKSQAAQLFQQAAPFLVVGLLGLLLLRR